VLERLHDAKWASNKAERQLSAKVHQAREFGMSWAEIGRAIGMTGQGAGKKYGGAGGTGEGKRQCPT